MRLYDEDKDKWKLVSARFKKVESGVSQFGVVALIALMLGVIDMFMIVVGWNKFTMCLLFMLHIVFLMILLVSLFEGIKSTMKYKNLRRERGKE